VSFMPLVVSTWTWTGWNDWLWLV